MPTIRPVGGGCKTPERSQPKLVHGTVVPEFDVGARVFHQKFGLWARGLGRW